MNLETQTSTCTMDNDVLNWETCLSDESNKGRVPQVARHQIRMGDGQEGDGNKVT